MDSMFAIGIALTAKDALTPTLKGVGSALDEVSNKKMKIGNQIKDADKKALNLTMRLKDVDHELKDLSNRRVKLDEKFKRGEISADKYKRKLGLIDKKTKVLSQRRIRLSKDLDSATKSAGRLEKELKSIDKTSFFKRISDPKIGTALLGASMATRDNAKRIVSEFANIEDAKTQLENTLMKKDGSVSSYFGAIDNEATKLGNALPGTTADFYNMASALKSLGVGEKSIVGGGLSASAYLGVVTKTPYDQAATSVAKFKEALGIADSELLPFIDDVQRMYHMGVRVQEMQYAFSKVGSSLKDMGLQGLQGAKDIEPLIGMLIKGGMSGETVGTGLGTIMTNAVGFAAKTKKVAYWTTKTKTTGRGKHKKTKTVKVKKKKVIPLREFYKQQYGLDFEFTDKKGKFAGIDNMIVQFEKLKKITSDVERSEVIKSMFGTGQDAQMVKTLASGGTKAIDDFKKKMKEQADINQRVENSMKTLSALWEALTGTASNALATIGESWSGELKGLTKWLGDATASLNDFAKEHPHVTKLLGAFIIGVPVVTGVLGTLGVALAGVSMGLGLLKGRSLLSKGPIKGLGDAVCTTGGCATKASGAMGGLNSKIGGIGKLSFAQIAGITALGAAFIGLNMQIANMGKADIDSKHIVGKDLAQLKKQEAYLKERISDSKKAWYTPGGFSEKVWHGTDKYQADALEKRLKHTQRAITTEETKTNIGDGLKATQTKAEVPTPKKSTNKPVHTQADYDKARAEAFRLAETRRKELLIGAGLKAAQTKAANVTKKTSTQAVQNIKKSTTNTQNNHVNITITNPQVKSNEDLQKMNIQLEKTVKRVLKDQADSQANRSMKGGM